jgi:hypothetical protein
MLSESRQALSESQIAQLHRGKAGWFEPVGRGWRTCDGLVKRGLMEHNGAQRGKGERYRTIPARRVFDPLCRRHPEVCGNVAEHHNPNSAVCQLPNHHEGECNYKT